MPRKDHMESFSARQMKTLVPSSQVTKDLRQQQLHTYIAARPGHPLDRELQDWWIHAVWFFSAVPVVVWDSERAWEKTLPNPHRPTRLHAAASLLSPFLAPYPPPSAAAKAASAVHSGPPCAYGSLAWCWVRGGCRPLCHPFCYRSPTCSCQGQRVLRTPGGGSSAVLGTLPTAVNSTIYALDTQSLPRSNIILGAYGRWFVSSRRLHGRRQWLRSCCWLSHL